MWNLTKEKGTYRKGDQIVIIRGRGWGKGKEGTYETATSLTIKK